MRWLDQYLGRLSTRLAELVIDKVSAELRAATRFAEGQANRAQGSANAAVAFRDDTTDAMKAVLDAEKRLTLALQGAREWGSETAELRKAVTMMALAGDQLVRRAAMLEQIEKTIVRRVDMRIAKLEDVLRHREELNRAERLRLNEQAERWRLLAMSRIEATLEETPGRVAIST